MSNRALSMAVRRQEATAGSGPAGDGRGGSRLDAEAVAAALAFHRGRSETFTPTVVAEVRTRLGLDPIGGIGEDLVQAVARFQQTVGSAHPALAVNGMIDANTAPRLLPAGLARPTSAAGFAADADRQVLDGWVVRTSLGRGELLIDLVNQRLAAAVVAGAGVPPMRLVLARGDDPNQVAQFVRFGWMMYIDPALLDQPVLDEASAADLVETVYHEARHAEQNFRVVQLLAGRGLSRTMIAEHLRIAEAVVLEQAIEHPIRPGTSEALAAHGWYDSRHGRHGGANERVFDQVHEATVLMYEAARRYQEQPGSAAEAAFETAKQAFIAARNAYLDIPTENDAWVTGLTAGAAATDPLLQEMAGNPTP